MKKYIIYSLIITLTCGLGACNNDEGVDKANSIFSTEEVERSPFDNWILGNYTHPYNIALKYRMEDNESDMTHVLAPADYKKSVVLAKIIKHVWLEAYDEATGNPVSYTHLPTYCVFSMRIMFPTLPSKCSGAIAKENHD